MNLQPEKLQDALHFAIMTVSGVDKHGRESSFMGRSEQSRRQWGFGEWGEGGEKKMTRPLWRQLAHDDLRAMGVNVPKSLNGEKLIRRIDHLAHSIGWDAYMCRKLEDVIADGYIVANYGTEEVKHRRRSSAYRRRR